jgi:hypothetical protein
MHDALLAQLRDDLTRRRAFTPQVCRHLASTYELADDEVSRFLNEELSELEEYRIELLFGPLFTPTLEDRARYSRLLSTHACDAAEVERALEALGAEGPTCDLELPTGEEFRLRLADVLVERYVRLLYLADAPAAELAQRLEHAIPGDDLDLALATLREEAWHGEVKRQWLADFLDAVADRRAFSMRKLAFLSDLLRGQVRPDTPRMLALVRSLLEERRGQLGQVGAGKPFFARHIEEWHGHDRDQRRVSATEVEARQQFIDLLDELVVDLGRLVAHS